MYASNCPVSRPKYLGYKVDNDLGGGVAWSNKHGYFYPVQNEMLPIKRPDFIANYPIR